MAFQDLSEVLAIRPGQPRNRSVRSIQAALPVPAPPSAHIDGGSRIQYSPRICLGIPIASRPEERHEATTRAPEPNPYHAKLAGGHVLCVSSRDSRTSAMPKASATSRINGMSGPQGKGPQPSVAKMPIEISSALEFRGATRFCSDHST